MGKKASEEKKIRPENPIACRLGVVGGQAVLEGVMMKHGDRYSLAVRKENGEIELSNHTASSIRKKNRIFNLPIIRGVVNMAETLKLSYGTLMMSAEAQGIDADEVEPENKFEEWLLKHCGKWLFGAIMGVSTVIGFALAFVLFTYIPSLIAKGISKLTPNGLPTILISLIEGLIRMAIFVGYLAVVSLMKDIRRTFEYHGAEHKSIFCYEAGEELTPENVKRYVRFHPRCGTSFIFLVLLISILVGALPFIPTENLILRVLCKLALLPVVVGLGYEFLRYAGKHDNAVTRFFSAPGLWIQRLTTKEPDLEQIAVAIAALKASMPEEFPGYPAEEDGVKVVTSHSAAKQKEETEKTEESAENASEEKPENPDA